MELCSLCPSLVSWYKAAIPPNILLVVPVGALGGSAEPASCRADKVGSLLSYVPGCFSEMGLLSSCLSDWWPHGVVFFSSFSGWLV